MAGRTAIGLDIGTSGVRAAELSFGKDGVTLEKFGQVALPRGRRPRRRGRRPRRRRRRHQAALVAHQVLAARRSCIGVANQKVIVRQVDLPWMPDDELKQSLAFQVQDFIPMPVDQAVLDFHPLEELTSRAAAGMLRGLLVAASRDMVMNASTPCSKAGLNADDGRPHARSRCCARSPTSTTLGLRSPRSRPSSTSAPASPTSSSTRRRPALRPHPAHGRRGRHRRRRRAHGRPARAGRGAQAAAPRHDARRTPTSDHPAARVIETTGAAFVDEVRGSLDYYLAQRRPTPLSRVVLTGGGARLGGLRQRLPIGHAAPGRAGAPLSSLQVGKTGLIRSRSSFVEPLAAVPVGLAMGVAS